MSWCKDYFTSSIGKKQVMGVSGLLLCGFLFTHLLGNLTLLISQEAFNNYAHTLTSNPLIYGAEVGLAALFFLHIAMGLKLTVENRKARGPRRYAMRRSTGRGETLASRTMIYTGMWVLIFLGVHVVNFRIAGLLTKETVSHGGREMVDLYSLVMTHFQSVGWTVYYLISMAVLGLHLAHGFSSAFQSLGINHPHLDKPLKILGVIYSLLIVFGFSAVALFCHLKGGSGL